MADVTLSYKDSDILELSDSGSATLKTGGTYCEADIEVEYVKPSGGGDHLVERLTNTLTSYSIPNDVSSIPQYLFDGCSALTQVSFPSNITLYANAFSNTGLTSVHLHSALLSGYNQFRQCPSLETFVCENLTWSSCFYGLFQCAGLATIDVNAQSLPNNFVRNSNNIRTYILRSTTVTTMTDTSSASGTSTIYIPKSLFDHLGDGTAQDYKAATNWATLQNVTWAQIEGSYYETHYADGTEITS